MNKIIIGLLIISILILSGCGEPKPKSEKEKLVDSLRPFLIDSCKCKRSSVDSWMMEKKENYVELTWEDWAIWRVYQESGLCCQNGWAKTYAPDIPYCK